MKRAEKCKLIPTRPTNRVVVGAAIIFAIGLQLHAVPLVQAGRPATVARALEQGGRAAGPPARRDFADLPGARLWFTDTGGTGEPVVLLHANTGTSEVWGPRWWHSRRPAIG